MRGVLHDSGKSLDNAFMNMQESMSKFKEACRDLQDAGTRVAETKRKVDDVQDLIRAHRERCRRVSEEYGTAEEDLNECPGRMGQLMRDTAGATHASSCCTTDRDFNEVRYLQEALDMMEDFQRRRSRREVAENILLERQR